MGGVLSRIAQPMKLLARSLVGTVTCVSTADNVAALTFDDGPDPRHTPRLLDVLDRYGARATFFMVGESAARHRGIVQRVAAAGHAIGNHSFDHPSFPFISSRERRRQVRACDAAIAPHGLRLFRSPGGHQTPRSVLDVRCLKHRVVGWNIDPQDYSDRSAAELAMHVLTELRPGSIVLLHDALYDRPSSDRTPTIEAVRRILASAGGTYEFVTVPELFRRGRRRTINAFWRPPGKGNASRPGELLAQLERHRSFHGRSGTRTAQRCPPM
jgi:peptidoglycan-N-acetylglucosamine deacetylase